MSEPDEQRPPDPPDQDVPERVYPPHEVQARLGVSASGLRRLAGIYERTVGPLPRDERGRVWPEDAVGALEDARVLVRESRAVSIEAALRGQELEPGVESYPATQRPSHGATDPGAAILEELRALRRVIEEQNARIAELEEAVRTGGAGELESGSAITEGSEAPSVSADAPEEVAPTGEWTGPVLLPRREDDEPEPRERGLWQRVAAWFGFGGR